MHLLAKAKFDGLTPDAHFIRQKAANKLADKAKTLAIPLAHAFLASFIAKYGNLGNQNNGELDPLPTIENATDAFTNSNYNKGLGILIGLATNNKNIPNNVAHVMERLKKAFCNEEFGDEDDPNELLTCDGPGVMLIALTSQYNATTLQMETNVFQHIQESIKFDMRGTILLVVDHAAVTCGKAKSSLAGLAKAKEQVCKCTHFLKTVVSTVFPSKFNTFIETGHIFVSQHYTEERTQIPNGSSIDGVSFYIHYV